MRNRTHIQAHLKRHELIAFIVPRKVNLPLSFPILCRETDKCASPPPSSLTLYHPHPPSSPALPQAGSSSGKRRAQVRPPRNGCSLHSTAAPMSAPSDVCCGASANTLCDSTRAAAHANAVSLAVIAPRLTKVASKPPPISVCAIASHSQGHRERLASQVHATVQVTNDKVECCSCHPKERYLCRKIKT
jgi:hypothetical protein